MSSWEPWVLWLLISILFCALLISYYNRMARHAVFFFWLSGCCSQRGLYFVLAHYLGAWRILIKMSLKGQTVFWNLLVLTSNLEFRSCSHICERKPMTQRWCLASSEWDRALGQIPPLLFFLSLFFSEISRTVGASPRLYDLVKWRVKSLEFKFGFFILLSGHP